MRCVHKLLLKICLILALCSCGNEADVKVFFSDLPAVNIPSDLNTAIEVKHWLAIGPFEFNPLFIDPVKSFNRKDLRKYGIKEGWMDEKGIKKVQRRGVDVLLIDTLSPQIMLFDYVIDREEKKSNFYLVSKIYSEKAQEVTLIIDGSYSYAAWLNGDKLIEVRGKHNVNKAGDRFVNISLKEGENQLFVKVSRGTNKISWDLICAITSRSEGERIYRVNYAGDFVTNSIVNKSLEIYSGPYQNGKVEIMDEKGEVVAGSSFENQPFVVSGLNRLKDGFYKATLILGDEKIRQVIYKGDYLKFAKKTKMQVDELAGNSLYIKDLHAACQRIEYLNNQYGDPHSPNETRFLNRNRVYWGFSLLRMLQNNATTQLMTYENQEGEPGIFIFHNTQKSSQKIPLVIIVPAATQGNSMIEDWYTSNLDQIETDNALADKFGFAVAWIYAGGTNYSAIETEKEITAIINRLQSEYNIDTQKIFITGDCEGGRRALVQLALSPGRYAACVVASPITLLGGRDGVPLYLITQMDTVPILIQHGRDDNVSPVEHSRRFYEEAQKLNLPVVYNEVAGSHVNVSKDGRRYVFDFFSLYAGEHVKQ